MNIFKIQERVLPIMKQLSTFICFCNAKTREMDNVSNWFIAEDLIKRALWINMKWSRICGRINQFRLLLNMIGTLTLTY